MKKPINQKDKIIDISASIVLFKEDIEELTKTIQCFLNTPLSKKLFLIDNTPNKLFENKFNHPEISYLAIGKNIGFGAGHNIIISELKKLSNYHLILNPDVQFNTTVVFNLIQELEKNKEISMIAPKVLFPNGNHQYSCRRYPTIQELIVRRSGVLKNVFKQFLEKGIYKDKNLANPFFVEYITGCFQLYKTEDFIKINGFDERYFLYMEDVDICRKIDAIGKKKLYYPKEEIYHILKQGSSKKLSLFLRHLSSAIKYFKKWGF